MAASSNPITPPLLDELASVHAFYRALAPSHGLGGSLLFAGEISKTSSHLLRAANIAGTASLAASSDQARLRQAMHQGTVDFLVTSLDEALRILKNEIRKRQPVAVAVSAAPEALAIAMLDRGVQPDLLFAETRMETGLPVTESCAKAGLCEDFLSRGARPITPAALPANVQLHVWPIAAAWARRMAELDDALATQLPEDDHANRRWLRLSPRYLGTRCHRLRSLACSEMIAQACAELLASR
jgi:hypothetical protein